MILTAARSGSTLLRFVLDSHPELACPPEASPGSVCASLARLWQTLRATAAQQLTDAGLDAPAALEPEAAAAIRQVVDDYYRDYLARRRKRRWCDKSLDNVIFASLIGHVFPDARFICLYRHCMDMIASGVEASPWGLQGFGFENFVVQYPGNSIAALGSYWLDRTRTMLAFEQQHPGRCLRIRYEDLVSAPEEAAASMFSFLDVEQVPGITETCFRSEHDLSGQCHPAADARRHQRDPWRPRIPAGR